MDAVETWTGELAGRLRAALRLTNEALAERLGISPRTVARWNAAPGVVPSPELQQALDTLLSQATENERARFAGRVPPLKPTPERPDEPAPPARELIAALDWLDRNASWTPGTANRRVQAAADAHRTGTHENVAFRRARVQREDVANALSRYYGGPGGTDILYAVTTPGGTLRTSMLTAGDWLAADCGPLRCRLSLDPKHDSGPEALDAFTADAAVLRLAEIAATGARLVNEPLYRLTSLTRTPCGLVGTVTLTEFAAYALTLDLIEGELLDALGSGKPTEPGTLQLRDSLMPTLATVKALNKRLCVGGPPTLTAIARPKSGDRGGDYIILIQERSGRVLNAARRLSTIPKAFHGPLSDPAEDADIVATVEREMEEELFGRLDVDSTRAQNRSADPMHPDRLSEPMRWLDTHRTGGHWHIECTGFGLNLVSGNFEVPMLLVVEDEEWWARFGGRIEANWESDSLRRYSTRQPELITSLLHDPGWSNEGLLALAQGLRRLRQLGGPRVNLPTIDLEERP